MSIIETSYGHGKLFAEAATGSGRVVVLTKSPTHEITTHLTADDAEKWANVILAAVKVARKTKVDR